MFICESIRVIMTKSMRFIHSDEKKLSHIHILPLIGRSNKPSAYIRKRMKIWRHRLAFSVLIGWTTHECNKWKMVSLSWRRFDLLSTVQIHRLFLLPQGVLLSLGTHCSLWRLLWLVQVPSCLELHFHNSALIKSAKKILKSWSTWHLPSSWKRRLATRKWFWM